MSTAVTTDQLGRFGGCPQCGAAVRLSTSTGIRWSYEDWLVCHEHRVKWKYLIFGYDGSTDEPMAAKNRARIADYVEVQPLMPIRTRQRQNLSARVEELARKYDACLRSGYVPLGFSPGTAHGDELDHLVTLLGDEAVAAAWDRGRDI